MDETDGSYIDDEWFEIHGYDDDSDHDTNDDTGDDTDGDTDTDDADDEKYLKQSQFKSYQGMLSHVNPRLKDVGPCFGTNEHPRRDTNVRLRQSKALIELSDSR